MRKMLTKEVTKTNVKLAKIELVDGLPTAVTLPDEILLGNVQLEAAQKALNKKHGQAVTILQVSPSTEIYEMPVEEFIKVATIKAAPEQA